jgi:MOSC domain-containing protein YiiM
VKLLAVNTGLPTELRDDRTGRTVRSGIGKRRVTGDVVRVGALNIVGDGQADLENHGGVDKAVYAYSHDHLPAWMAEIGYGDAIDAPFGENLSVAGVDERGVCIGDRWQWGEAVLEVAQPRWPCFKLGLHAGHRDLPALLIERERSGWYSRVIVPGEAPVRGELTLLHRDNGAPTVREAFQAARGLVTPERAAKVAACPGLASRWQMMVARRLV